MSRGSALPCTLPRAIFIVCKLGAGLGGEVINCLSDGEYDQPGSNRRGTSFTSIVTEIIQPSPEIYGPQGGRTRAGRAAGPKCPRTLRPGSEPPTCSAFGCVSLGVGVA